MKKFLIIFIVILFALPIYAVEPDGNIVILMYHDFRESELDPDDDPLYVTTGEKFKSDMETLLELGYNSLNLEDYYYGNYDAKADYFIVTVDDGYISNYTVMFPILLELEIYADIFICTENTLLSNHFKYGDAKKMEESGFVKIYSHLTKHQNVLKLKLDDFMRIAFKSYKYLSDRLSGERLMMTAYPYGSYSRETVESLYATGTVFQLVQGKINVGDDDWNAADYGVLYRVNVEHDSDIVKVVEEYIMEYYH
ncbi:MAG: polysaccharide deacetylase family protein [Oscillospiraceae bacterium]|nr:polysaccharide deacetylase family protein [Oscillospiraceae bacterium]